MLKALLTVFMMFTFAPLTLAQVPPPPPPGDFPPPHPPEGKKKPAKKHHENAEPERKGVKPPAPVTPPSPETTNTDAH